MRSALEPRRRVLQTRAKQIVDFDAQCGACHDFLLAPARCRPRTLKDRKIVRHSIKRCNQIAHPVAPEQFPLLSMRYAKRRIARTTLDNRYFP
ncbi:cAMP-dependent 3',5'-cyclic phosphodiesterase 4A domain protein [Burkholderia thailandensis]|uniref:cAMP-dependent 3',5'-cyclic phosphodiesterase 4A domain protein n=1 Tax=Burkholderia thailandensis TaxID=57975 RepID=A0AAW9CYU2_BURTH|nr:cAMP-dependent 3',5'-cyclic phosphodiesterase 4A domain protein [Burkholderia thailandensis]MDW9254836.1 cAMP-dependent 3',5'-cyclic phosphodiesterase 4A domain protein [Burkholderia thailandensis]